MLQTRNQKSIIRSSDGTLAILTVFLYIFSLPTGKYLAVAQLGRDRFFQNSFRFTLHQSSYKICDTEGVVQEQQGKEQARDVETL